VETDLSPVARLIANPARAAIVATLLGGRPTPAGELARIAGVGASTASEHLNELVNGGLVSVTAQGRHRYFSIASADVAEALEAFSRICPKPSVKSLRQSSQARALSYARTCYDHLAGALGVALFEALLRERWLIADGDVISVSDQGVGRLDDLGIDVKGLRRQQRCFARPCLDWTERKPHLAGSLGAALACAMLDRGWVERQKLHRGLLVTPAGERCWLEAFDCVIPPVRTDYNG
jgi:DNA-binding transcriptional ArsR family regulator